MRGSPLLWISLGLVSLTVSFILAGNAVFDLNPELPAQEFKYRRAIAESLAIQFSQLAERDDVATIEVAMRVLVDRHDDILSAALVRSDHTLVATAGDHEQAWVQPAGTESTLRHLQIPIFAGDVHWATLQVAFQESGGSLQQWAVNSPWVRFMAFVALFGFVGYFLFMKKTLRELNPSAVIPKRVKAALDVLAEGVVLLDKDEAIVLANAAFGRRIGQPSSSLLGGRLTDLPWKASRSDAPLQDHPWTAAIKEKKPVTGVGLVLAQPMGHTKKFIVNSSPILDEEGSVRGVLSSFDDVTELEQANGHLLYLVRELKSSQEQMRNQSEELARLATRDPLTGCFNRHTFLEKLEEEFAAARANRRELGCIVIDIDHLKSFNERYGHAVGDQVINVVARTLGAHLRPSDILGRLGGEEFCILLPGLGPPQTEEIAERLRRGVLDEGGIALRTTVGFHIAASFGVSSVTLGASDALGLVGQAERALLAAKQSGRNRIVRWDQVAERGEASDSNPPQASAPDRILAHG